MTCQAELTWSSKIVEGSSSWTISGCGWQTPALLQYSLTHVRRAGTMNLEDSWMYEDGQDEIVFSVDTPCQLLGAGLCGTEGAFTAELELLEVRPACFDFSAITADRLVKFGARVIAVQ